LARKTESVRRKLAVTAKKLRIKAAELAVTAREKEDVRRKLLVTAKELKRKAKNLAVTAREKEDVRRKLVVTAEKLRIKAAELAVTAKEKENTKRKLVVTAKELKRKAQNLAVTAKEKESIRRKLVITAKELKLSRLTLEKKVLERTKDLEQARVKGEAILASIGDGIVVADKEGKITYVNKTFEDMVGWKAQKVLGKYMVEVVPREDEKGNVVLLKERILSQVLSGEKVIADVTQPFYYIRKDKSRFPASSIVTPIVLEREIIGIVETFRDITKEKNIDKAKTEFVSLASHQLRTPLTSIRWALSSLKREHLPKEQIHLVNGAHEAAVQMAATINKMLMISRIEMGGIEEKRSQVDVRLVIEKVARLFDGDRERHALELVIHGSQNLRAHTDEQLLIEILSNLLNNAYNYTPKNGKVTVRATTEDEMIRIDVTDTGYGIPRAEQGNIAEKFFRASNIASREEAGTGIGLYMVYNIVRLIGGTIFFVSEENKGTTFTLLFPS